VAQKPYSKYKKLSASTFNQFLRATLFSLFYEFQALALLEVDRSIHIHIFQKYGTFKEGRSSL
jgi:hypothetical protein